MNIEDVEFDTLWSRITSFYEREISGITLTGKTLFEKEVIFGYKLKVDAFNRVREYYNNLSKSKIKDSYTIDYSIQRETEGTKYRFETKRKTVDESNNELYSTKKNYKSISASEYDFRININTEEPADHSNIEFDYNSQRKKRRRRYDLGSGNYLDLTYVTFGELNFYEVELEFQNLSSAKMSIMNIVKLIQNTTLLYKIYEYRDKTNIDLEKFQIYEKIRSLTTNFRQNKPVNLKIDSLYDNSLKTFQKENETTNLISYTVTAKTDGFHKFCLICDRGVYLFNDHKDRDDFSLDKVSRKSIPNFLDFILEGELYTVFGKKIFYIFDVIRSNDRLLIESNIGKFLTHRERLSYVVNTSNPSIHLEKDLINFKDLHFDIKSFYTLYENINGNLNTRAIFKAIRESRYNTDGVIFTSGYSYYDPIYKWKPLDKLSIDFLYKDNNLWYESTNGLVKFQRTRYPSFDPLKHLGSIKRDSDNNALYRGEYPILEFNKYKEDGSEVEEGDIVECIAIPVEIQQGDIVIKKYHLIPYRKRLDKIKPNFEKNVNDVWEDMNRDFNERVLIGNTLKSVISYHGKIKQRLFQDRGNRKTLVDIGAGEGGDIKKYTGYSRVLAIEPDSYNYTSLKHRIANVPSSVKITPIQMGGEEPISETILNNTFGKTTVDRVTMMLSLSFFFKNDDAMLIDLAKNLCNLLDVGGDFVFFTINGYELERLFRNNPERIKTIRESLKLPNKNIGTERSMLFFPYTPEEEYVKENTKIDNVLILNDAQYIYNKENTSIQVTIKDSIVRGQEEFFVDLYKLEKLLSINGFELKYLKKANDYTFSSESENLFTGLYTHGRFVRNTKEDFAVSKLMNISRILVMNDYTPVQNVKIAFQPEIINVIRRSLFQDTPLVKEEESKDKRYNSLLQRDVKIPIEKTDQIIKMQEIKYIEFESRKYYTLYTPGNLNSCLLHSVLQACCKVYQDSKTVEKNELAESLRKYLYLNLDNYIIYPESYKKNIDGVEIHTVYVEVHNDNFLIKNDAEFKDKLGSLLNTNEYLDTNYIPILSNLFKINIRCFVANTDVHTLLVCENKGNVGYLNIILQDNHFQTLSPIINGVLTPLLPD